MKKLLLIFLVCLSACAGKESLIEGQLPDASYDNEFVYLVPFKGASKKTVDSTLIRESRFLFKIKPEKQNRVYIIRVKPALRLLLQDILIIPEQGTVFVNMDKNSSSSGTPLNLTLQQWKERKLVLDTTYYSLRRRYKQTTDEAEKNQLQTELDSIIKENRAYMDSLAKKNKDNPVGQLIKSLQPEK